MRGSRRGPLRALGRDVTRPAPLVACLQQGERQAQAEHEQGEERDVALRRTHYCRLYSPCPSLACLLVGHPTVNILYSPSAGVNRRFCWGGSASLAESALPDAHPGVGLELLPGGGLPLGRDAGTAVPEDPHLEAPLCQPQGGLQHAVVGGYAHHIYDLDLAVESAQDGGHLGGCTVLLTVGVEALRDDAVSH